MGELAYDYKYTDTDVRSNPNLIVAAVTFLTQYNGDFEFLVNLKRVVQSGHRLGINQIRGVLNCMLGSALGAQLLADTPPSPKPATQPKWVKPQLKDATRRKATISLRAKIKAQYMTSPNAGRVHLINHERSSLEYDTDVHPGGPRWRCQISVHCNSYLNDRWKPVIEKPSDLIVCKQCTSAKPRNGLYYLENKLRRADYVVLPAKWKGRYLLSAHVSAQVFHELDTATSEVRYYPELKMYRVHPVGLCGKSVAWGVGQVVTDDPSPYNRRPCRNCQERLK